MDALLSVLEDVHRGTSITKISLSQFSDMLTDKYDVKECTVEQLRGIKGTANLLSSSMDKTNDKLKYYQSVKVHLENAERERPIEEQFPFVRTDMDEFDRQLNKLFTSRAFVENRLNNESDQMELAVQQLFRAHLKREKWDYWDVPLLGGKVYRKKDVSLVQWDAMIGARRDDEFRLFLVETKIYPHANDIICDKDDKVKYSKCLYERGMRTIAYLASLSDKNIKGQCDPMRMQDNVLLELVDAKVELVYSSRIMNDEIKERIGQISTRFRADGYSVNVSFMECPSVSEGTVTSILSDSDLSAVGQESERSEVDETQVEEDAADDGRSSSTNRTGQDRTGYG